MGQLFFKKPYQEAIRAGRKRTTIRRWDKPRVRAGEQAFSPGLGWLMIEAVDAVELERLGEADAVADGFETASEMRTLLLSLYPRHQTDGKQWFRVHFVLHAPQPNRGRRAHQPNHPRLF